VIESLEKLRDEKILAIQKLGDETKAFFNAKRASDERAGVHAAVGQMVGDRTKVKDADGM